VHDELLGLADIQCKAVVLAASCQLYSLRFVELDGPVAAVYS